MDFQQELPSSCIFNNFFGEDYNELTMMVFGCESLIMSRVRAVPAKYTKCIKY